MKIELSLLSATAIVCLLLFCGGSDVGLHALDIDFSVTSDSLQVSVDPVWAIWSSQLLPNCNAFALGNVMVFDKRDRGTLHGDYLIAHELVHVRQFQALGWWVYPARLALNIEPDKNITTNWNDKTQPERTMWTLPSWWPDQWSFITITIGGDT